MKEAAGKTKSEGFRKRETDRRRQNKTRETKRAERREKKSCRQTQERDERCWFKGSRGRKTKLTDEGRFIKDR